MCVCVATTANLTIRLIRGKRKSGWQIEGSSRRMGSFEFGEMYLRNENYIMCNKLVTTVGLNSRCQVESS